MPNFIVQRASGYYLRYVLPKVYCHLLPQRELRYSLRTRSRTQAKRKAREVLAKVERLFDDVCRGVVMLDEAMGYTLCSARRKHLRRTSAVTLGPRGATSPSEACRDYGAAGGWYGTEVVEALTVPLFVPPQHQYG